MSTGRALRGVNIWLTAMQGYPSPWWGTFDQIARLSGLTKGADGKWYDAEGNQRGVIRKGQQGTVIVFWKRLKFTDRNADTGEDETKIVPILRYYRVWNACQAVSLPERYTVQAEPGELEEVASAELIIKEYLERDGAPTLDYDGGNRAYYVPGPDTIHLPERSAFDDADHFYDTAFHEMTHSTGHETRCNRPGIRDFDHFGSEKYGKEELAAEMGAAMLAAMAGTDGHFDNSAAYVASWLRTIKGEPRLVIQAAAQAQHACDHILGISYEKDES
jgi:antirestriction protein ArdC